MTPVQVGTATLSPGLLGGTPGLVQSLCSPEVSEEGAGPKSPSWGGRLGASGAHTTSPTASAPLYEPLLLP